MTDKKTNTKEGNIIWLASYPKSGNTWLRIFLNNLLSEQEEPVDINALHETGSISSARGVFDEMMGIDSADLTQAEIDYYLPFVHTMRSEQLTEKQFIKTHDAFTKNKEGKWIIPLEATYKVVYLIRNPLDVCVSFAHHAGHTDFDKTIKSMSSSKTTLAKSKKRQNNQLPQHMGSWSDHVNSWTKNVSNENLLVVRYEDMKQLPQKTFAKIVRFVSLDYTKTQIADALEKSKMDKLQQMEVEKGFGEKMQKSKRFFRKGIIGSWRDDLILEQSQKIINDHSEAMCKYGYLGANGELKV